MTIQAHLRASALLKALRRCESLQFLEFIKVRILDFIRDYGRGEVALNLIERAAFKRTDIINRESDKLAMMSNRSVEICRAGLLHNHN